MCGSNLRDFDWLIALGEDASHSRAEILRYSPQNMVNSSCDERRLSVGPCHSSGPCYSKGGYRDASLKGNLELFFNHFL